MRHPIALVPQFLCRSRDEISITPECWAAIGSVIERSAFELLLEDLWREIVAALLDLEEETRQ
jgi:hypothetical protein